MKLNELEVFVTKNLLPGRGGKYFIFVKLITHCGIVGYGEVYAASVNPKTITLIIEDVFQRNMYNFVCIYVYFFNFFLDETLVL